MWHSKCKALLIDIHGVLFNSSSNGEYSVIEGSIDAIKKLQNKKFPFMLLTNESQVPPNVLLELLNSMGFQLQIENIYSPLMAIKEIIEKSSLKPFSIISDSNYLPNSYRSLTRITDLKTYLPHHDIDECDSVVVTDAHTNFSYETMNKAFQFLIQNPKSRFLTAGKGKYYRDSKVGLVLDLGPFTEALEFATDRKAEIIGKPGNLFFRNALNMLHSNPDQVIGMRFQNKTFMVGDDILNDVGGAQSVGMFGVLVRSGKYRPEDEHHPIVKPIMIVNCINDFVEKLFAPSDL